MIHPTAIVHPKAKLDSTVRVGPYAVIDEGVHLGAGCEVGPYCYLTGLSVIGANNRFFAGCVIGEAPQDLKYKGEPTGLRIGNENVFREHATVHRSAKAGEETVIGSRNFLMAGSHVGHNCRIADDIILAGGALLAGHVSVDARAFISGTCLVHQFTRVGTLSLMQGGAAISKDLPPFTIARGYNGICGLNVIGLRRAGIKPDERLQLKQLYHELFRPTTNFRTALASARKRFSSPSCRILLEFVGAATRGVCFDAGGRQDEEA